MAAGVAALGAADARAMQVNPGDLMLALFSNGTEYYRNLGPASTLLAGAPVNVNLGSSPLNPMGVTTGANPVLWGLISAEGQSQVNTFMNTASTMTSQQIVDSQTNNLVVPVKSTMDGWRNQLGLSTPAGNEATLAASDPASWASTWGLAGNLGGVMGAASFQGNLDAVLTMIKGQARVAGPPVQLNVFSDVGRATLTAAGMFSICGGANCELQPVPIPAAAVLFGSGLIGLIGIARRRVAGTA